MHKQDTLQERVTFKTKNNYLFHLFPWAQALNVIRSKSHGLIKSWRWVLAQGGSRSTIFSILWPHHRTLVSFLWLRLGIFRLTGFNDDDDDTGGEHIEIGTLLARTESGLERVVLLREVLIPIVWKLFTRSGSRGSGSATESTSYTHIDVAFA